MSASDSQIVEGSTPEGQTANTLSGHKARYVGCRGRPCMLPVSFFLAVGDFERLSGPVRGYSCAELALLSPFSEDGRSLLHESL